MYTLQKSTAKRLAIVAIAILASFSLVLTCMPYEAFAKEQHKIVANTKTKKTTKKKAAYKIVKYWDVKKFTNRPKTEFAVSYPILKGSSSQVKKINASIKKIYKAEKRNKSGIWSTAAVSTSSYYKNATFVTKASCKVRYNKNGYFSFTQDHNWFAGGVYNHWTSGRAYSLKTGKRLYVSYFVKGTASDVKYKIANAYFNKFPSRYSNYAWREIVDKKISDFDFYLKNGKVVVCFDCYPPGGCLADGPCTVTLKGNYS